MHEFIQLLFKYSRASYWYKPMNLLADIDMLVKLFMRIAVTQTHSSCLAAIVVVIFKVHVSDARLFLDDQVIYLMTLVSLMVIW